MTRRLLLLSNSTNHGRGYLDHAIETVRAFFQPKGRLVFVPFALHDREGYTAKARERFAKEGIQVEALRADESGRRLLAEASGVFVGGGNTFRLLKTLQECGLLAVLGERVRGGMPYMGASAGINVACPTLCTTNDMPIVEPPSFGAMGVVPFQINPHYVDPDPATRHMGETRDDRIREYLEENDRVVVGLREGAWLRIEGDRGWLEGDNGARLFRRGAAPEDLAPGYALDGLLTA